MKNFVFWALLLCGTYYCVSFGNITVQKEALNCIESCSDFLATFAKLISSFENLKKIYISNSMFEYSEKFEESYIEFIENACNNRFENTDICPLELDHLEEQITYFFDKIESQDFLDENLSISKINKLSCALNALLQEIGKIRAYRERYSFL